MAASKCTWRSVSPTFDLARIAALAAGVSLLACGGAERGAGEEVGADLVLVGGAILTMDPAAPTATALAVREGRIVAVGDGRAVQGWVGPRTRVIELGGRSVTPGLVDAHAHLYGLGASLENVSLRGAASPEEAAKRAAEAAAKLPAGEWVVGRGWDQNLWADKQFPVAAVLDRALGDRPAALRRVDGHALWASSAALARAGIDRSTPDPKGGRIVRDEAGRPTGVLIDMAMDLVESKIPPADARVRQRRILAGAAVAVAAGLTGVHEMGIDDTTADVYRNLADQGRLPLRVVGYLAGDPVLAESLPRRVAEVDRDGTQRFVLRGVKLFADGALGSRGARLLAPYADDPKNQGLWITPPGELHRAVEAAVEGGWQVAVHAIGDAAVHETLNAFEEVMKEGERRNLRLRVEHAQVIAPADLPRFARLGVIASMQPTHATSDMPWAEARVGPERIRGAYAWRTLHESGAAMAFGSDAPVEEIAPLLGLHAAVTRQDRAGQPAGGWTPDERVSLEQAIAGFTSGAAHAAFVEEHRGRLRPGMIADITVFDRPLAAGAGLLETAVDMTIVAGEVVYERGR